MPHRARKLVGRRAAGDDAPEVVARDGDQPPGVGKARLERAERRRIDDLHARGVGGEAQATDVLRACRRINRRQGRRRGKRHFAAAAIEDEGQRLARPQRDHVDNVVETRDRPAIDALDHVAGGETRLLGRAAGDHRIDAGRDDALAIAIGDGRQHEHRGDEIGDRTGGDDRRPRQHRLARQCLTPLGGRHFRQRFDWSGALAASRSPAKRT